MKIFNTLRWYGYLIVGIPVLIVLTFAITLSLKSSAPVLRQDKQTTQVTDTIKIEIKETVYDTIHIKVYETVPVKVKAVEKVEKEITIDSTQTTQTIE